VPREPSLTEILDVSLQRMAESLRTGMPAKVVKYDAATQTADVQPSLKTAVLDETGGQVTWETIPVIPGVPILFPRGGGVAITWGITPGDHVWLSFSETAMGVWRGSGITPSEGGDSRRHGLYPVAFAGIAPESLALDAAAPEGQIWLGDNPSDFVALASKVDSAVTAIVNYINSHTHPTAAPGPPSPPTVPLTPAPGAVGSTTVKVSA
jgi:hypothetical protein